MAKLRHFFVSAIVAVLLALGLPCRAEGIVVIAHKSAAPLTRQQITEIYLGHRGVLRPLDLPMASPLHERFYRALTGHDMAWVRSNWASVVFTGRGKAPQTLESAEAVKRAVAADANLIGYIEKSALDPRVQVLLELEE